MAEIITVLRSWIEQVYQDAGLLASSVVVFGAILIVVVLWMIGIDIRDLI